MFKFDLLFELEVPRPWTPGKERDRFHEALEQAVFAEQMGFSTIWLVEHHFLTEVAHSSAPDAMLGALTQRTSDIRLGFGVALMPGRVNHPIRVAERAATLDILSDGRVEMGTGRSSSPYQLRAFGVNVADTREEWEEATKLLPELWTRERFSYHGRFFDWDDEITVVPRVVQQPHPPLWVASTQPDTCQLAGEKGLGLLMPSLTAPGEPRPADRRLQAGRRRAERPDRPLRQRPVRALHRRLRARRRRSRPRPRRAGGQVVRRRARRDLRQRLEGHAARPGPRLLPLPRGAAPQTRRLRQLGGRARHRQRRRRRLLEPDRQRRLLHRRPGERDAQGRGLPRRRRRPPRLLHAARRPRARRPDALAGAVRQRGDPGGARGEAAEAEAHGAPA